MTVALLVALAIFSMVLGFKHAQKQRLISECAKYGHQWTDVDGLRCKQCKQRPKPWGLK